MHDFHQCLIETLESCSTYTPSSTWVLVVNLHLPSSPLVVEDQIGWSHPMSDWIVAWTGDPFDQDPSTQCGLGRPGGDFSQTLQGMPLAEKGNIRTCYVIRYERHWSNILHAKFFLNMCKSQVLRLRKRRRAHKSRLPTSIHISVSGFHWCSSLFFFFGQNTKI